MKALNYLILILLFVSCSQLVTNNEEAKKVWDSIDKDLLHCLETGNSCNQGNRTEKADELFGKIYNGQVCLGVEDKKHEFCEIAKNLYEDSIEAHLAIRSISDREKIGESILNDDKSGVDKNFDYDRFLQESNQIKEYLGYVEGIYKKFNYYKIIESSGFPLRESRNFIINNYKKINLMEANDLLVTKIAQMKIEKDKENKEVTRLQTFCIPYEKRMIELTQRCRKASSKVDNSRDNSEQKKAEKELAKCDAEYRYVGLDPKFQGCSHSLIGKVRVNSDE